MSTRYLTAAPPPRCVALAGNMYIKQIIIQGFKRLRAPYYNHSHATAC